jgi:hypothetical protein
MKGVGEAILSGKDKRKGAMNRLHAFMRYWRKSAKSSKKSAAKTFRSQNARQNNFPFTKRLRPPRTPAQHDGMHFLTVHLLI